MMSFSNEGQFANKCVFCVGNFCRMANCRSQMCCPREW